MKKYFSNILTGVVVATIASGLWSCASENPFEAEGEGTIRLHTVVNAITTRAEGDEASDTQQELKDKCIVYISSEKGLIYKKVGLHNVDSQITLKSGNYVAEAWTGDSVAASFDKKFFRGYQPFEVTKGSTTNVVLNCQIQNVVASVNTATINSNLMKDDYKINIKNSRGEVVFNKDNASTDRGYFMMPDEDTTLEYTISGSRQDGKPFSKGGKIENVKRAHHYILNFEYNPDGHDSTETGAVFIKIRIKEENIQDTQSVTVHSRPTINGVDFNIDRQLVFTSDEDIPESISLQLCGFGGLSELAITSESASELGLPAQKINLYSADYNIQQQYKDAGLEWTQPEYNEKTKVATAFVTFPKSMLKKLSTEKATEHIINISITDKDTPSQSSQASIRIARNESAIIEEDPITFEQVDQNNAELISSKTATLTFSLADDIEGTPGVEYCKDDDNNWTFVAASNSNNAPTRAQKKYEITIKGLEAGTTYKYRAACGEFHSDKIMKFTTYSKFIIPNANMEKWASVDGVGGQNGVKLPTRTGKLDFWGNGNPGAKMAGTILTDESSDMFNSASKSAKLESQFASVMGIGKFAAGNLFAGEYVKTDGTDGVLKFGQAFADFSEGKQVDVRPSALRVFVNYRPKTAVNKKGANSDYIAEGQLDQSQIYVALTTSPIDIMTKQVKGDDGKKRPTKLFNPDDIDVLAYGQKTLTENYGPDGKLQELIIPIEYFDRANGVLPTHLVIVCSASKFGDYFSGGEGSTMYLDDFELIYE